MPLTRRDQAAGRGGVGGGKVNQSAARAAGETGWGLCGCGVGLEFGGGGGEVKGEVLRGGRRILLLWVLGVWLECDEVIFLLFFFSFWLY